MNKLINAGAVNSAASGMKNKLINGNFDIWQRGTSQTAVGFGSADRWSVGFTGGTMAMSQYTNGLYSSLFSSKYTAIITGTATVGGYIFQTIENLVQFSGKTLTLSFMANVLSGANTGLAPYIRQSFGTGGSAAVDTSAASSSIVNGRYIYTYNLPATNGKTLGAANTDYLEIIIPFSGTYSWSIWAIQLEEGSVATSFENRHIRTELELCQRYYEIGNFVWLGYAAAGSYAGGWESFRVTKRAVPTITQVVSFNNTGGTIVSGNLCIDGFTSYAPLVATTANGNTSVTWTASAEL